MSFNEAGAQRPRKVGEEVAEDLRFVRFNEAGAQRPRKGNRGAGNGCRRVRFNEAGAQRPRKAVSQRRPFANRRNASMRPGRKGPGKPVTP